MPNPENPLMRTILFRGKRIDNGEWVYGFYVGNYSPSKEQDEIQDHFIYEGLRNLSSLIPVDPKTVGQLTGAKDKSGNSIWQGDILKCGYGTGEVIYNDAAACFMVQWIDDKEAMMEFIFSRDGQYSRRHDDEYFEIIGNIHDNPALTPKI